MQASEKNFKLFGFLKRKTTEERMELTWAGVLLLLCILFTLFSSFQMYKKKGQLPPGPTPWPILGNFFQLKKSYKKLTEKYGPIFTIWIGSKPMVALCGYEVVKDALINQAEEFGGRSHTHFHRRINQNKGISTNDEKKWRELRRFTLSTLRDFGMGKKRMFERVQEEALCLVEEMAVTKGQPFDPRRNLASAVSNVICAVVFGNRFDYKDQTFIENQQIVEYQIRFLTSFLGLVYNTFPKTMEYFFGRHIESETEKVYDYIREKVELHKKTLDPQNPRDYIDCFLHRMEKEQNSSEGIYTLDDLVITVLALFTAGTITTSQTLLRSLLAMAKLPHIQAKVQQEIDEVVGTNRTPSMEDRLKMPFTNAVVHEVQRYGTESLENLPRATTCDVKFHGYNIPKYMAVVPVLSSVHRDLLHWETPEKFNPDHFLNEKGQFRKRDAFMPFSAGKRACPGEALARMELFLFFSTLLQNFTFSLDGDTKDVDIMSLFMIFQNKNQSLLIRAVNRSVDTCVQ
ncbi:cytochrome P450 2C5-like isoform X1 [Crotalus tigris]|uniref:cytochrome P450 2C5-like isoform X1 n=2 Tax=Crotalus tigris TaxID=88082 RepID=UPI00192F513A|nr:cytochrome P450 2C5-like isoform X1 [Crotalus tigris]